MTEYTPDDFKRARFARDSHGNVAARGNNSANFPWLCYDGTLSDSSMAVEGWVPVPESRAFEGLVERYNECFARMEKSEKERDENGALLSLARDALAGTEAQVDAYKARLKKSEDGRRVIEQRVRDFADSIRREQDQNDRLRAELAKAEQPRPLTAGDITDEAKQRAVDAWWEWKANGAVLVSNLIEMILTAALTEPPARPEGAKELDEPVGEALRAVGDLPSPEAIRAASDLLASWGVRVTGAES